MYIKTVMRKFLVPRDSLDTDMSELEGMRNFDEDVNAAVAELKAPNPNGTFVKKTEITSHVNGLTVSMIALIFYTKSNRDYRGPSDAVYYDDL